MVKQYDSLSPTVVSDFLPYFSCLAKLVLLSKYNKPAELFSELWSISCPMLV